MTLVRIDRATFRRNPSRESYASKWLYDRTPTKVKCPDCGKEMLHTELSEVDIDLPEFCGTGYSCPDCSEPIELEWEKPEPVAKELGLA